MTLSRILKKTAVSSCFVYAAIIVIYSLLVLAFFDGVGMNPVSVFWLYPFSFVASLATCIVKYTNLSKFAKNFWHFVLFTLAVVLFIFLPYGKIFSPKVALVLFLGYCIAYLLVSVIVSISKSTKKRKSESKEEYKNVY